MNYIQTLITYNKNLTVDSFGWRSAEDHLNAWCLSSLLLNRVHKNTFLYTDDHGHDILVNHLKLPYNQSEIINNNVLHYDKFWAASKIITYSVQEQPFIHVDGDVFLWKRIPDSLSKRPIIAQNFENCGLFYKDQIGAYFDQLKYLPESLQREILQGSFESCNAGILGGNNLSFIRRYSSEAFKIIDANNHITHPNFNVLFEQILFASMARAENLDISTLIPDEIADNGYFKHQFCNFFLTKKSQFYMHVLGGMKRDEVICEMIAKTLHYYYPEHYLKVKDLFSNHRQNLIRPNKITYVLPSSALPKPTTYNDSKTTEMIPVFPVKTIKMEASVSDIDENLAIIETNRNNISLLKFNKWLTKKSERLLANSKHRKIKRDLVPFIVGAGILATIEKKPHDVYLQTSGKVSIYFPSFKWDLKTIALVMENVISIDSQTSYGIICSARFQDNTPLLSLIDVLDSHILYFLKKGRPFKDLTEMCCEIFSAMNNQAKRDVRKLIAIRIKSLYEKNALDIFQIKVIKQTKRVEKKQDLKILTFAPGN